MQPLKSSGQSISKLIQAGAHLTCAHPADKHPVRPGGSRPCSFRVRRAAAALAKHQAAGGLVGLVPASLKLAVLDVDSGGRAAVDAIQDRLGVAPVLVVRSRRAA